YYAQRLNDLGNALAIWAERACLSAPALRAVPGPRGNGGCRAAPEDLSQTATMGRRCCYRACCKRVSRCAGPPDAGPPMGTEVRCCGASGRTGTFATRPTATSMGHRCCYGLAANNKLRVSRWVPVTSFLVNRGCQMRRFVKWLKGDSNSRSWVRRK